MKFSIWFHNPQNKGFVSKTFEIFFNTEFRKKANKIRFVLQSKRFHTLFALPQKDIQAQLWDSRTPQGPSDCFRHNSLCKAGAWFTSHWFYKQFSKYLCLLQAGHENLIRLDGWWFSLCINYGFEEIWWSCVSSAVSVCADSLSALKRGMIEGH